MLLRLRVIRGASDAPMCVLRDGAPVTLGRSRSSGLRLTEDDVSGVHARITAQDGRAKIENRSRTSILTVNGDPVANEAEAMPQHKIGLGRKTLLVLEAVEAASSAIDDEDTADLASDGRTPATTSEQPADTTDTAASVPAKHSAAEATPSALRGVASSDVCHRDAESEPTIPYPHTNEPVPIRQRPRTHRGSIRGILGYLAFVGTIAGAVTALKRLPQERPTRVAWPRDREGRCLYTRETSPSGMEYEVLLPGCQDLRVERVENGLNAAWDLQGVPFRLVLRESESKEHLRTSLDTTAARWSRERTRQGKWNIDRPFTWSPFFGNENGVPMRAVRYHVVGRQQWSGVCSLFRKGRRLVALRVETPSRHETQAAKILQFCFFRASPSFVRSHWEGSDEIPSGRAAEILTRAEEYRTQFIPTAWPSIERLALRAARKAALEDERDLERQAAKLLARLRERQHVWFNYQYLKRQTTLSTDPAAGARQAASLCAVFASPEDQRHYQVREWRGRLLR